MAGPVRRVPSGKIANGSPSSSACCDARSAARSVTSRSTLIAPSFLNSQPPKRDENSSSFAMKRMRRLLM